MERVTGIEPAFSAWEADVLPLNYTRKVSATLRQASTGPAQGHVEVTPPLRTGCPQATTETQYR